MTSREADVAENIIFFVIVYRSSTKRDKQNVAFGVTPSMVSSYKREQCCQKMENVSRLLLPLQKMYQKATEGYLKYNITATSTT